MNVALTCYKVVIRTIVKKNLHNIWTDEYILVHARRSVGGVTKHNHTQKGNHDTDGFICLDRGRAR